MHWKSAEKRNYHKITNDTSELRLTVEYLEAAKLGYLAVGMAEDVEDCDKWIEKYRAELG